MWSVQVSAVLRHDVFGMQGLAKRGKSNVAVDEERVAPLLAMGFTQEQAVRALKAAGGNLERAAHWLLQ